MERSIIPPGFENTAHRVFRSFIPPMPLPESCLDVAPSNPAGEAVALTDSDSVSGAVVCPICLDVIGEPATVVLCRHHFCANCLLSWYKVRVVCPICKQPGSYFLRSLAFGSADSETKMWTVAAADGPELRPTRELIAAAVSSHKGLLARLGDGQHSTVQGSECTPRKRARIS